MSQHQVGWLAMRHMCDKMGVVGAAAKHLSLKRPLAAVLQSCALFCSRKRLTLRLSHRLQGHATSGQTCCHEEQTDSMILGRSCRRSKYASPSGKNF